MAAAVWFLPDVVRQQGRGGDEVADEVIQAGVGRSRNRRIPLFRATIFARRIRRSGMSIVIGRPFFLFLRVSHALLMLLRHLDRVPLGIVGDVPVTVGVGLVKVHRPEVGLHAAPTF